MYAQGAAGAIWGESTKQKTSARRSSYNCATFSQRQQRHSRKILPCNTRARSARLAAASATSKNIPTQYPEAENQGLSGAILNYGQKEAQGKESSILSNGVMGLDCSRPSCNKMRE